MADINQEITFENSGLNWDDDYRFMAKGDAEYRLNVVPNEFGNTYVLTNAKGNTAYNHSFTHNYTNATYECVGDCYDDNRDSTYFFIYSDSGYDSILRFNFSDNSFNRIVWDHSGIGLDPAYPITDAFMIGNWLHFNPRTSSPRVINVEWARYDFLAYELEPGPNRVAGDYLKICNKVYRALGTIDGGVKPEAAPDYYEFIDYCYEDVFPLNTATLDPGALGSAGEYYNVRNFYNTTTPLPYTPSASVETDTSYEYNNIRGRRFQFCYRHYVPDQGYTNTSSFTDIIAPPSSETNKGEVVGDIGAYNKITISFPVAHDSEIDPDWTVRDMLFEFVEILFREGPDDDWKVASRIDHTDIVMNYSGNTYSVDFFNDKSYDVVDNVQVEKQYNPLPKLANAQWSLDGERSAYGGITEGFNNVVGVDVTLTPGERELTLESVPDGAATRTYAWSVDFDPVTKQWHYYTATIATTDADAGDALAVEVNGVEYSITLTGADVATAIAYASAMVRLLALGGVTATGSAGPIIEFYTSTLGIVGSILLYGPAAGYGGASQKYGSFKNGAWHPFCLYYYDEALRRSEPVFDESMRVYVETLPEALTADDSTNYQRYIDWVITHLPPQWARYWRWGYAGNQTIDKFWQYNIESLTTVSKDTTDDWTRIDISPLQQIADDASGFDHYFPDTVIEAYSYEPGDRVRFICDQTPSPTDYDSLSLMTENFDYEIKEFDDVNHYIYIDELTNPATTTTTTTSPPGELDTSFVIEIYRPKKQTGGTVYHEFGELRKVYLDSGVYYHKGDTVDQDAGNDAEGQFNSGDVYVITRLFSQSPFASVDNPVFVESYGWSDFHNTDGWGKGKAGAFNGIGEKYLNNIRYSNRYSPNTRSSGLSTFDPLDYKEMSTDHGNITAMRQAGNTLKVYFERNSASVLVNKTQFYDADGNSQILKSDKVLGDAVYSNYHYGTIFPESVFLKDRTVYFFDIYRDAFLRDSPNGLESISDYKMRRYFNEKAEALLTSGISNVQVWTTYDYDYDMVYVHFIDEVTSSNSEIILFHEPQNRWVTFMQVNSSILEVATTTSTSTSSSSTSTSSTSSTSTHDYDENIIFGKGSMKLVSYVGDGVYIHNSNSTRNNFWGSQRESIVEVIANEAPNIKKTFEAMAIHSNKPWDINYINVAVDATYTNGMQSKLPESRFTLREGIYCANYLRNMKTYSSSASNLDLVRGEMLRGYYAQHRLINDDTTEVTLFKVDVSGNVSRI